MKNLSPTTTKKSELRKFYLKLLKETSKNQHQKWNQIIFKKFQSSHYFKQNQVFALYHSLHDEVDTKAIIELLWANAKQVCLPRMVDQNLEFYYFNSWDEITIDNNYQIGQPNVTCKKVKDNEIECMLIPLVAFDQDYYRIGYGKGFYDRYLSQNKGNYPKIGLSYDVQKIPFVFEHDPWDISLDFIFSN